MILAAYCNKDEEIDEPDSIVADVDVGKTRVIFFNSLDFPEGWERIPFYKAIDFVSRDSASWYTPDNASEGLSLIKESFSQWVDSVSKSREVDTVTVPSLLGANEKRGGNKMSLSEIREKRRKQGKYGRR